MRPFRDFARFSRHAACALSMFAAAASAGSAVDMPPEVEHFLDGVQTLSAAFDQTLIDADGLQAEASSGTLDIARPGRFRWVYREPYEQWLVADGRNVWSYDVDLEQVTVKPQATALANTPALLLGGADDVLAEFDFIASAENDGLTWARFAPRSGDNGFRHVDLAFRDGTLARMVFYDNLDQTTVIALTDVVVNGDVDDGLFTFEVPEGVDLVGTPDDSRYP